MTLALLAVLFVAGFVAGLLVGRKHPAIADGAASVANVAKADAQAVAADVQKKA